MALLSGRNVAGQKNRLPPHKISIEQTVAMAKDFELLVLFTSTPGFQVDVKIAEMMKDVKSEAEGGIRRPAGYGGAGKVALSTTAIDFVVRREFDYQIADYAKGTPLEEMPGVSFRKNGGMSTIPKAPPSRTWMTALGYQSL